MITNYEPTMFDLLQLELALQNEGLYEIYQTFEKVLKSKDDKIDELENELSDAISEKDEMYSSDSYYELEAERDDALAEVMSLEQKYDDLESANSDKDEEIYQLESQVDDLNAQIIELVAEMKILKGEK